MKSNKEIKKTRRNYILLGLAICGIIISCFAVFMDFEHPVRRWMVFACGLLISFISVMNTEEEEA